MSQSLWHLAEINVARAIAPLDDPRLADFVAQLETVNAIADASPGFVWRLKASDGGPSSYVSAFDDPRMLINISVWESIEALHQFTYRSHEHVSVFRDRRRWFEPATAPSLALWWIRAGELPATADAIERLEHLRANGPTPFAFSLKERFEPTQDPAAPGKAPSSEAEPM